jgi:hypothetical protein
MLLKKRMLLEFVDSTNLPWSFSRFFRNNQKDKEILQCDSIYSVYPLLLSAY